MKFKLIYPKWKKLIGQTEFHLPPHGPVVFAATIPPDWDVEFTDENVEPLFLEDTPDFVGISMMLTSQVKRGWEIGDIYRKKGVKVIFGGIATMLHADETMLHADSVFLGEAEGHMENVFTDFRNGCLKPRYDYMAALPSVSLVGSARRSILKRELYYYKGVQMVDLVHASRGCRFNCYPCCVSFLGGRQFRPRPYDKVIEEISSIDNNRLFMVDNSLAQDKKWELGLFREMIALKKKWCCHPIEDDDEVLDLAFQAGAWYVYQAIFDTSDYIRNRVRRYKSHGIAVEGTILLGLDGQTEDDIRRLVDFLLEIELDLAEFTILTPFPHTRTFHDFSQDKRILSYNWNDYTADKVVFRPDKMSPEKLQDLYAYAWDTFYKEEPQSYKMFKLLRNIAVREKMDGTYLGRRRDLVTTRFGEGEGMKLGE